MYTRKAGRVAPIAGVQASLILPHGRLSRRHLAKKLGVPCGIQQNCEILCCVPPSDTPMLSTECQTRVKTLGKHVFDCVVVCGICDKNRSCYDAKKIRCEEFISGIKTFCIHSWSTASCTSSWVTCDGRQKLLPVA